jgi:hypothetical protein
MTPTESPLPTLLPSVRALSRPDKLRLLHFLAGELVREEGIPGLEAGATYPIWTPFFCFEAAAILQAELDKTREGGQPPP